MAVTKFGENYASSFQRRKDEGQLKKHIVTGARAVDDALRERVSAEVDKGRQTQAARIRAMAEQAAARADARKKRTAAENSYSADRLAKIVQAARDIGNGGVDSVFERMNQYDRQEEEKPAIETPEDIALGNMTRGYKRGVIGADGPLKDGRLEYADARIKAARMLAEAEKKAEEEQQTAAPAINLADLPKLSISPAGEVVGGDMPTANLPRLGEEDPMRLPGITAMPDRDEIHTVPTPEEYAAQQAEAAAEQEREAQKYNGWRALGANLMAGTADIGANAVKTINAKAEPIQHFLTDAVKWVTEHTKLADMPEDTAQKIKDTAAIGDTAYDTFVDPAEQLGAYADAENAKGGKAGEIWGSVVRSIPQNAMSAVLALMSGGTSVTGQAAQALKTAGGGMGRAVLEAAKQMGKNPALWNSFVQTYGSRYEAAEADGADPVASTLTATITTLMNAAIETGGVENLPFESGGVYGWVKSALEEGREEVIQQVIDQLGQKAYVDSDIPWYSAEDERAVINPAVLGENALVGTLAGGLVGVPGAIAGARNSAQAEQITPEGVYPEVGQADIEAAARPAENEQEAMARLAEETVTGEETQPRTEADVLAEQRTQAEARRAQTQQAARAIASGEKRAQIEQAAAKYGEDAQTYVSNYKGGDTAAYDRAFGAAYAIGQTNLPLEKVSGETDAILAGMDTEAMQAAWTAGRNNAARTVTPGVKRLTTTRQTAVQRRQYRMLDEIGKRYGYEFDIVDSIGGVANGAYVNGGRRITVAADAVDGAIVQAGVHELVHALKSGDAEAYGVLESVVVKHLTAADSMFDLEYAVGERMRQYAASGQSLTREDAVEEIVCEAVPTIFTDGESVKEFVRTNRTLAEKIRDFFVQFAEEIREIAERYMANEDRDEIANLLGKRDALKEIARTLDEALEAAGENNRPQDSGDTEFARKRSKDAEDVEKWTPDGQFMWEHMSAAERGVFRETLNNTPKEKLQKSADGQYIVEAGRALLYTDGNRNNPKVSRIVYFYLDDGTELDGAMYIWHKGEKEGAGDERNREVVESYYGDGCIVVHYNGDRREAAGQNEGRKGEAGPGAGRRGQTDGGGGEGSKFSLMPDAFHNWFGESKVVNEDGSPKVMYHGSAASFTAFDKKKARSSGLYGRGFYFTDSDSHAGQYGSPYQVYLKVENPLTPGGGMVTRTQVKKFLEAVAENEDDYSIENYGTYDVGEILNKVYQKDAFALIQDVNATAIGDFVEAVKLFNEVNGTEYDGIIVPTETVVFEPTQIKSATDNIGTYDPENPDIRFSLKGTAEIESVLNEKHEIMAPVDIDVDSKSIDAMAKKALREGVEAQTEPKIRQIAGRILKETGSRYDRGQMVENLTAVMKRYAEGGADEETLRAVAEMSKAIIEKSTRADNSLREQYADVRRRLRETGVRLTEVQKQEAANISGSYDEYRRSMMGTVKITEQAGDLTSQWDELSGLHPELFAPGTSEGDMVDALRDFQLMMKPRYENRYGMDMDTAAVEMALRIEGDLLGLIGAKDAAKKLYKNAEQIREKAEKKLKEAMRIQQQRRVERFRKIAEDLKAAKARGDHAEQAKIMNRYRAAMKATGLEEAYAEVRATYREREAEKAENRVRIELRDKVVKRAADLMSMLTGKEKGKRVPTALQNLVLEVLETLDINGERAAAEGRQTQKAEAYRQRLAQMRRAYEEIWNSQSRGEAPEGLDGLMMTISERNLEEIREALDVLGRADEYRLREMTGDQLKALDGLLKTVKHTIESVGRLWRMKRYENVQALGDASIAEMDARGEQKLNAETAAGQARDFLALDMLEPISFGERLGKAGQAVIQALMDGEKIKFARIREAAEATRRMLEAGKLTGYDIGKWRRNVRTVKLGSGRTVKMTDTMLMSLYLTAKRPQGLQHLLGNGMRIPTTKETGAQAKRILLTQADIAAMGGLLTDRQRALADRMGRYLSTDVAKWGNDVTQRLYLYDAFTENSYWPISSDPNMLKSQEPEGDRAFNAIVNAGFTKPLNQKANNPVIISDAFDVFNRHIGEMASYAGYAEAMTDTMAWINYRQRTEDGLIAGTVKESMEMLLGNGGVKYLTKLVQDINGARRGGDSTQLGWLMSNYKRAAVMGKIRVAIQQPTSIVRAAAEINPAYLLAGLKAGKGAQAEMQKYSSLAWWKAHGNYEIGIGRGTDAILWGETSRMDAAIDTAAKIGALGLDPGKVDDWAWTRMWSAVKREISRTRPELAQGSEAYFSAVAERFEAIMDRTQVVDTVMHRSDMMRSKDGLVKSLTSFMSEPTKGYNMMGRAVMEAGRNSKDKRAWRRLAASTAAFAASGAATAAMTALFDAIKYRDDEDDLLTYMTEGGFREDWTERWLKGLIQNINPLENIPIVSDAYGALAGGEDVTVTGFQGLKDVKTAADKARNYFFGDNSKKLTWYGAVSPTVKAVSELTGLPLSGMMANAEALAHLYNPSLLQAKSSMATTSDAYMALYKAMAAGDGKKALEIRTQLAKGLHGNTPKNPKEIDTGIARALAQQDPRVMQAYEMRLEGSRTSELVKLKKQIMADGFTDQQVTAAINYCATLLETEETEKDMNAQLEAKLYTGKDLFNAIRSGDLQDVGAVAEYLESVSDAKDPAATIKNSVSSEFRAEYLELIRSGRQAEADKLAKKLAVVGIDAETTAEWVKSDRYDAMRQAVADGDAAEAAEIVAALQSDGATVSGIVSALNYRFKDEYVELVKGGRQAEADRLAQALQGLGLYYKDGKTNYFRDEKLEEWVEDAE